MMRSLLVFLSGAAWYALQFALAYALLLGGAWVVGVVAAWVR